MGDLLNRIGVAFIPFAWAVHVFFALIMQTIVALILGRAGVKNAWWIGAALAIGFYWGSKQMEFDFILQLAAHLHTHAPFWYRGWLPFEWPLAWQFQFYAPVAAVIVAALTFGRRRGG
jgi:hypothetical protein